MGPVEFVARAFKIPPKPDACQKLIEMFLARGAGASMPPAPLPVVAEPERNRARGNPKLPFLAEGSCAERIALAKLRHVCVEAIDCLVERGMIRFCYHLGHRCWVITDSTRRAAQPRRLDGQLWFGKSKVISFTGSQGDWPCGIHDASRRSRIAICEGAGDGLAAAHLAIQSGCMDDLGIVVMLGARQPIPEEALSYFKGLSVRLFIDNDKAGEEGKDVRKQQLLPVAGHLSGVTFQGFNRCDGVPVKDLNDLCLLSPDDYEARREFIENLMFF